MLRVHVSAPRDGADPALVAQLEDVAALAKVLQETQIAHAPTAYTNGEGAYGLTIHVLPDAPDPLKTAKAKLSPAELDALRAALKTEG